jgi:hypothetical protein
VTFSAALTALLLAGCRAGEGVRAGAANAVPAAPPPAPALVHAIIAKHSGHRLAIREGRLDDGADAIQWTDSGGPEQKWEIVPAADGCVRIRALHSGMWLTVADTQGTRGARVVQTADGATPRSLWRLDPAGGEWFRVVSWASEQYLAISRANQVAGEAAIQWTDSGGDEQRWRFAVVPAGVPAGQ